MSTPRYSPGDSWRPLATALNSYGAAADWYAGTGGGSGPPTPLPEPWQGDVRWIRNDSGEDCDAGDVLAIDGVVVTPEDIAIEENFLRWGPELIFIGVKPDLETPVALNKHVGHFAVLLDPIPHDESNPKYGRAVYSGIVTAPIDLVYAHHPFADVAHDTFRLTSNWYGSAEILYNQEWPAESDNWFAAMRVSNFRTQELLVEVSEGYGIPHGSSGDAKVYWGGVLTNPLQTIEIHFTRLGLGNTLSAGTMADVRYNRSTQHWEVMGANCE